MLFNSLHFMLFFPLVVFIYFKLSHRHRWKLLLAASYYFYMAWKPGYLILILFSTLVDYYVGLRMATTQNAARRKLYLVFSLVANLGLLFTFKYFNFFNEAFCYIFEYIGIEYSVSDTSLLLPVGISFYTFQTLSYTIEIYRGKIKPEKHLGRFALFVAFFPQLVAGPIERAKNLLPQIQHKMSFDYQRITDGLKLIAWGLFKKIVIADRLAILVNRVYNDPQSYDGPGITVATVLFAYQIYCDFSGYSDIAIGTAQVMGFNLMENFRRPYHARSISDFWHRWHISLSTWFRDFLYIPLGGNRVGTFRLYCNILVVFVVSGLWHGANWTFIVWGALHGGYLIFSLGTSSLRKKILSFIRLDRKPLLHKSLQIFVTFLLVNFAWIFFRANSLTDAIGMAGRLLSGWGSLFSNGNFYYSLSLGLPKTFLIGILSILFLECIHILERRIDIRQYLTCRPFWIRWMVYYFLVLSLVFGGVYDQTPFIYFQF